MQHCYRRDSEIINYQLTTEPLEAIYWSTYRLKKSDITLLNRTGAPAAKFDRSTAAEIKQEIFDDIVSREPNPSKKSSTPEHKVPKKRKVSIYQYAQAG